MLVLTETQMRAAEENAVLLGMNMLRLMENAGAAVASYILKNYSLKLKKATLICGNGNNGGDGYVVARKLLEAGLVVTVIAPMGMPKTKNATEMASRFIACGGKIILCDGGIDEIKEYIIKSGDITVDAIFGIGISGDVNGVVARVINLINSINHPVVSVDIPSGMMANSNSEPKLSVNPTDTVALAAYKPCHIHIPSAPICGKITCVNIGMPAKSFDNINPYAEVIDQQMAKELLPKRDSYANKFDCGTAGLICGSYGMAGSAIIAIKSSLRSGVGLVRAAVVDSIYSLVSPSTPEAVFLPLSQDAMLNPLKSDIDKIEQLCETSSAVLIGPGCSVLPGSKKILETVLWCAEKMVIDADGINMLPSCIEIVRRKSSSLILTPHEGEAARFLNVTSDEVRSHRPDSALCIAKLTNSTVVLKGKNTIIADKDGNMRICMLGNAGMATAGCGDMLAGIMVAFLAQGLSEFDAASLAVYLHSLAGDMTAEFMPQLSMLPTDMVKKLPFAILQIEQG